MKTLLLAILTLGVSVAATAAPVFRNPLPVGTGVLGFGVMEEGDFNGDGRKDVLGISGGTHVISVLLANGTASFAAPTLTPIDTNYSTTYAGIGDVNEDGKTDLLLLEFEDEMLGVMLGNGDGTFTQGPRFPGSTVTGPLALADFNGDHHLDIAVGTKDNPTMNDRAVVVQFGNGAGTFSGAVKTSVGSARFFRTFDIDGDGKTDLVVGGSGVYLGNGGGGFTLQSAIDAGPIAPGDFNHDGKLDLALATERSDGQYVQVWFGAGGGALTAGAKYPCGQPSDIDAVDINADGNLDLLVTAASSVTALRGKADGTFQTPETWLGGPTSDSIITDDFDRDGKMDFVTLGSDQDLQFASRLTFVHGNGDGTFRTSRIRPTGAVVPAVDLELAGGTLVDMNGDHHLDVVIEQKQPAASENTDFGVLLNDGTGSLAAPILTDSTMGMHAGVFAVGDVNNDNKLDVVTVATYYPVSIARTLLSNGDGTFATPIPVSVEGGGGVFLGDFTGDPNLDLFVQGGSRATVYPGNGNGTFGTGIRTDLGFYLRAIAGDLNGDGKTDWIGSFAGNNFAFINDGAGHFTGHTITNLIVEPAALSDFNGDGKLDLLATIAGGIETWLGNGDGTFAPSIPLTIMPQPSSEGVAADFDGDGKMDVALGTSIFLGNGDGHFRSRARVHLPNFSSTDAGDMDGNGSPDLVTVGKADDVAVFLTRKSSDPTAASSVTLSCDQAIGQYGNEVTFTATVTGGVVPLTGAVTFSVNGTSQAIVALDLTDTATYTTAFAVGTYNVTATYAGDENYLSSTKAMTQTVAKAKTIATIVGGPSRPAKFLVTIYVGLNAPHLLPFAEPTGALTLRDGNTPLNLTITNKKTTTRDLAVGTHVISVDYPGDANYEAATASYTQVITREIPTVSVSTTPSGSLYAGTLVKFRAYSLATPSITGTITFMLNDVVQAIVPLTSGAAELQLKLPWGNHVIQANYSGDDSWAPAVGSTNADVLIGPWGTPVRVEATANGSGSVSIRWAKVTGGVWYTLWQKKSVLDGWQSLGWVPPNAPAVTISMDVNKTWMYAATVTDADGNVSPMGPADIATAVSFTNAPIVSQSTKIKAAHVNEVRAAIASVRTFAGLTPYSYMNTIAAGQLLRATDLQEMRTALTQARTAIGLPTISFVDPTLTPSATPARASHIDQLRAGTD